MSEETLPPLPVAKRLRGPGRRQAIIEQREREGRGGRARDGGRQPPYIRLDWIGLNIASLNKRQATELDAEYVLMLHSRGYSKRAISRMTGVWYGAITRALAREAWDTAKVLAKVNQEPKSSVRIAKVIKTHCDHGHPLSLQNTYVRKNGSRRCRVCARQWTADARARRGRKAPVNGS